jgi:hypothetical protein
MKEFHLSHGPQRPRQTMTVQATAHRISSSAPHAYLLPVVRELPSLPTPALTKQW